MTKQLFHAPQHQTPSRMAILRDYLVTICEAGAWGKPSGTPFSTGSDIAQKEGDAASEACSMMICRQLISPLGYFLRKCSENTLFSVLNLCLKRFLLQVCLLRVQVQ